MKNVIHKRDSDMIGAEAAIKRAALKVWETARKNGRAVVFVKNGKIHKEYPK